MIADVDAVFQHGRENMIKQAGERGMGFTVSRSAS